MLLLEWFSREEILNDYHSAEMGEDGWEDTGSERTRNPSQNPQNDTEIDSIERKKKTRLVDLYFYLLIHHDFYGQ